jgi:hypothetical protein
MANKNIKDYAKKFTSEYQPTPEAKSLGHLKKKTLEELKNSILDKSFKLIDEKLDDPEITSTELQNIFNKAVEMSGFKKDKIDTTIKSYSLFEEETENKAINLESEQQPKKTNKK